MNQWTRGWSCASPRACTSTILEYPEQVNGYVLDFGAPLRTTG